MFHCDTPLFFVNASLRRRDGLKKPLRNLLLRQNLLGVVCSSVSRDLENVIAGHRGMNGNNPFYYLTDLMSLNINLNHHFYLKELSKFSNSAFSANLKMSLIISDAGVLFGVMKTS